MSKPPIEVPMSVTEAPLFALDQVSFTVGGVPLLAPLTLQLAPRRVTGLIGHNGSGKSTLVKLLARQLAASAGTIRFEGQPLRDWPVRRFARKVAYLPQLPPPATGMLVRELVAMGRYPWHGALGRFGQEDEAAVAEALVLTEVEPLADRLVDTLSGGERQRVWLAMLVAQNADCLLLDEPISALDLAHQMRVLSLVRSLSRTRGLSVLIVLHDVNMAARFCDDVIALHTGQLIARGSPAEVMQSDRLEAIYGLAMDIIPHPGSGAPICVAR